MLEFQRRECRDDSLKMEYEKYLKKEKTRNARRQKPSVTGLTAASI